MHFLIKSSEAFDFLKYIPDYEEINLMKIPPYTKPSFDKNLIEYAQTNNAKYLMSTSTISLGLSQLYYLVGNFQNPLMNTISNCYLDFSKKFMISQRKPTTKIIRKMGPDMYAMDSDSEPFTSRMEILLFLGKVLERMYTMSPDEFNQNLLQKYIDPSDTTLLEEDHHRMMMVNNNICLRSQIDCMSTKPDGNKIVYEIKSRAIAPMRYDLENYFKYFDYNIDRVMGTHSSFEREYYDLIRSAFLKYFFQLKIGRMDGALVGYHNTKTHFGFEYISLSKIEKTLFGSEYKANQMFVLLNKILTTVLDNVLEAVKTEEFSFFRLGRITRTLCKLHYGPPGHFRGILQRCRL